MFMVSRKYVKGGSATFIFVTVDFVNCVHLEN